MQGLASSYNAHLAHGGPPVLPMYKSLVRKRAPQSTFCSMIPMLILLCGFLGFFFCSIYIGATYLHDHLQDEKWGNTIGLPGTRNVIQKWSLSHLGGIDLTTLGPPANRAQLKTDVKHENPFHFNFHNPFGNKPVINAVEGEGVHDQVENLETAELVPQPGHISIDKIPVEETELEIPHGEISVEEAGSIAALAGVGNRVGIKEDIDMDVDVKDEESLDSNSENEEESDGESEEESERIEELEDAPAQ